MATKNEKIVENMRKRWAAGDRGMLVLPFDFKILEILPDFNTEVGGLYQLGSTSQEVQRKVQEQAKGVVVSHSMVSTRLRVLHMVGFARPVKTLGASVGKNASAWQKTELGKEELEKWQRNQ